GSAGLAHRASGARTCFPFKPGAGNAPDHLVTARILRDAVGAWRPESHASKSDRVRPQSDGRRTVTGTTSEGISMKTALRTGMSLVLWVVCTAPLHAAGIEILALHPGPETAMAPREALYTLVRYDAGQ